MPLDPIKSIPGRSEGRQADSFVTCIQAAVAHWGRPVTYECVAALGGTVFSPGMLTSGRCAGCWMEFASDARIEFMSHALGFTVEWPAASMQGGKPCLRGFIERARPALDADGVVVYGPNPRWKIVTGPGGELSLLQSLNAPSACSQSRIAPAPRAYILRPIAPSLTRREATLDAVRFSAMVATGRWRTQLMSYGTTVYDAWLAQMAGAPFCPAACPDGWLCAKRAAQRIRHAQLAAAGFLDHAAALLPGLCRDGDLSGAAMLYGQMAATLQRFPAGSGDPATGRQEERRSAGIKWVRHVRKLHGQAAERLSRLADRL